MKIEKLAVQLHTVKPFMQTEKDVEESFKKIKALGYDQAQTAKMFIPYETFGELADKAGIEIIGTHDDFELMCTDFDAALERHKALGTYNMGLGAKKFKEDLPELLEFTKKANMVGEKLKPYGGKFTYHNHHFDFLKLKDGRLILDALLENMNSDTTSIVLDTYWVQYSGGDVAHWIKKLKGRIDILHLKDMIVGEEDLLPHFAEVGNGNLNWDSIIEAATESGVKYFAVEQDICPNDPFESLRMSSEFMHKYYM